ncbi:hypothetical protein [Brevibacillus sp. 179-C9.3 HS]|uniref:hypothetical protein n=1 Tax=unclassified Brevibacillus TaxID=2684853 RepID=UPI00399F6FE7
MRKAILKVTWFSIILSIAWVTGCQNESSQTTTIENTGNSTQEIAKATPHSINFKFNPTFINEKSS